MTVTPPGTSGVGEMLEVIRTQGPCSRAQLAETLGLARSTVAQRLDKLLQYGLVIPEQSLDGSRGRPTTTFTFNWARGAVLVGDLGATHSTVAITDLAGVILAEQQSDLDISAGPEEVLGWLERVFARLLDEAGLTPDAVLGVGVGLPGPVEFSTGTPVRPPIMPGWDGYPVGRRLSKQYGAPVLVDNDVNLLALGEHRTHWPTSRHLLCVKVATGIGMGIIIDGRLARGAQGSAGDIGHVHLHDKQEFLCTCGNRGCLEAVASGGAMAKQLRSRGLDVPDARNLVKLVAAGNLEALDLLRQSGRLIGEVLAAVVNVLNPSVIVINGDLAEAQEPLIAGIREMIYLRSLPLATRDLQVVATPASNRAGVVGAATMVLEAILAPEAIIDLLARLAAPARTAT